MSILINTIYAALTWLAVSAIGFSGEWGWLGIALAVMAALQTFALLYEAVRK